MISIRRIVCSTVLAFSMVLLGWVSAQAQVQPTGRLLPFSGKMPGQPDGPVTLRFRLFPVNTGGVLCFEETQTVQVAAETFSALIGDATAGGIPPSPCFTDNPSAWIAFALDSTPDVEIGVRTPVTSSGFAHSVADGGVTTPKIADGAVMTAKLADGAVTTPKLADSAVTTPKLAANSVDSTKIAPGAVGAVAVNSAQVQLRVSGDCTLGNAIRVVNADGTVVCQPAGAGGGIDGGGAINQIAKFTGARTIGNSVISELAGNVGIAVAVPGATLDVGGPINSVIQYNIGGLRVIHNFGTNNFFAGVNAGNVNLVAAASDNTSVGLNALMFLTTGSLNTATGSNALASDTTGNFNTADGFSALRNNTTGSNNTAIGINALRNNTIGALNSALGDSALFNNRTGTNNTASGVNALLNNADGFNNTAIGHDALRSNNSANNTAVGESALLSNTTGGPNTAVGFRALASNDGGGGNTAIGATALTNNTSGIRNTASGVNSLFKNTTGGSNTATGIQALYNNDSGNNNTAVGDLALSSNVSGQSNTAVGVNAIGSSTVTSNNTAVGFNALLGNSQGSNNTAIGAGADVGTFNLTNVTVIGAGASTRFSNTIQLGNDQIIAVNTSGVVRAAKGFGGKCADTTPDVGAPLFCNQDVAETFAAQEATEPGDLVVLVNQSTAMPTVRKSTQPYEGLLVGAVSTSPGLVFDRGETLLAGDNSQRITAEKTVVGLVGRVPVKVSLENGPIAVGDPITSSSTKGVAMKATRAGQIIGYALQKADQKGKILVLLQPGYYLPPQQLALFNEIKELKQQLSELKGLFHTVLTQRVEPGRSGKPGEANIQ